MRGGGRDPGIGGWALYNCEPHLSHILCLQGELTVGEDDARIVQRHLPFVGGLAYGIDQLLEPPGLGARCDTFETRPLWLVREARGARVRAQAHLYCSDTRTCCIGLHSFQEICGICGREPPCPEGSREQVRV